MCARGTLEAGEGAAVCILVLLIEGDGTDERLSMTRLLADQGCVVRQVVDTLKHNVKSRGNVSHLTPKELALLGFLMKHADREVNRTEIMKEVWETEYMGDTRTIEVHIRWLRRKLEDDTKRPIRIVTVRRVGYRFQSPR
jgi:DNA-binding response OmpR family regulator